MILEQNINTITRWVTLIMGLMIVGCGFDPPTPRPKDAGTMTSTSTPPVCDQAARLCEDEVEFRKELSHGECAWKKFQECEYGCHPAEQRCCRAIGGDCPSPQADASVGNDAVIRDTGDSGRADARADGGIRDGEGRDGSGPEGGISIDAGVPADGGLLPDAPPAPDATESPDTGPPPPDAGMCTCPGAQPFCNQNGNLVREVDRCVQQGICSAETFACPFGCGSSGGGIAQCIDPPDAGPPDSGIPDSGAAPDATPPIEDAATPDAPLVDAGPPDAGPAPDVNAPDATPTADAAPAMDARAPDAQAPDAAPARDAAAPDATAPDATGPDAGFGMDAMMVPDAANSCTGTPECQGRGAGVCWRGSCTTRVPYPFSVYSPTPSPPDIIWCPCSITPPDTERPPTGPGQCEDVPGDSGRTVGNNQPNDAPIGVCWAMVYGLNVGQQARVETHRSTVDCVQQPGGQGWYCNGQVP